MTALPYNFQGKGVGEGVSGITISQISASAPKWKPTTTTEELEEHQLQHTVARGGFNSSKPNTETGARTSSIENLKRRSPSSPTSTSTLSSFNVSGGVGGGARDSDPASGGGSGGVAPEEGGTWNPEPRNLRDGPGIVNSVTTLLAGGGVGCEGSGLGTEWGGLYSSGADGNLLPWIMGESDELGCGLKHFLQSGNVSEFEGNGGLGLESIAAPLIDTSCEMGSNLSGLCDKEGRSPNVGSGLASVRMDGTMVANELSHVLSNNVVTPLSSGLSFPVSLHPGGANSMFHPQQLNHLNDEKPQIYDPEQLLLNPPQNHTELLFHPATYCQQQEHPFQPPLKRRNSGVSTIDSNLGEVSKSPVDPTHTLLFPKQQLIPMIGSNLPPHHFASSPSLEHKPPLLLSSKPKMVTGVGTEYPVTQQQNHHEFHPNNDQQQFHQDQAYLEQLYKAADLIHSGKFSLAQEILARLNHQLSFILCSGNNVMKPALSRACFYVKEALLLLLSSNPVAGPPPKCLTPFDVVHKLSSYKVFSEVSPISQFMNFTTTQAILEAVSGSAGGGGGGGDSNNTPVHILDFDIGCGAQWASFIQELPLRKRGSSPPTLKITAFASLARSHPFELALVRDNLCQFATEVGISFDLQVISLESFDPASSSFPGFRPIDNNETVAVNFPVWSCSSCPYVLPSFLRFIKQYSPKIIVSMDRSSDRWDLPFPQHVIHSLDASVNLLESLDGLGIPTDVVNKFEKFFVQPRIESALLGRLQAPDKMPHWRHLFVSNGLLPLQFSNFTEAQGDYLVKRNVGRGFRVEQRQGGSLVLTWQRREIVAAYAWRC